MGLLNRLGHAQLQRDSPVRTERIAATARESAGRLGACLPRRACFFFVRRAGKETSLYRSGGNWRASGRWYLLSPCVSLVLKKLPEQYSRLFTHQQNNILA